MLGFFFAAVSIIAAVRLLGTPLAAAAVGAAAVSTGCYLGASVYSRIRDDAPPRWVTALQHVASGMGGFFLFVSLSLPGAP